MTRDDWVFLLIGIGVLFAIYNIGGEAVVEVPGLIKIAANAGIAIIFLVLFIFFYWNKKRKD